MLPANTNNQNWLPSFFNDFFENDFMPMFQNKAYQTPAINIIETENGYELELATPGMSKEDFKLTLENNNELTISLEKKTEVKNEDNAPKENAEKKTFLRHEFSFTSFKQSYTLPEDIDLEKISAKMENGILTVALPKKEIVPEVPATRQIAIN